MLLGFVNAVRNILIQYGLVCEFDFGNIEYSVQVRVKNPDTKKFKDFYVRFDDEDGAEKAAAEMIDTVLESSLMIEGGNVQ